ncbi:hypothetical protein ACJMK2_033453 [Sinanodonta woodiana]|uniref:Uncharacterized protein n=1 Tax=Sinanodonta woodiana TaxID=1069815 RepID=A0ABD3WNF4_SINWO
MVDTDHRNRVIFLGAGGVGKTSILKRFLTGKFADEYRETVEELYCKDYSIDGTDFKVDFLDTAGNLEFPAMRRLYISTAHAYVLVYSITNQATFLEVKSLWEQIKEVRSNYEDLPCVIVGNKLDLEDNRQVEKFDALNWVYNESSCGAFVEVSAKANDCIKDVFKLLLEKAKNPRARLNEPFLKRRLSEHSLEQQKEQTVEKGAEEAISDKFGRSRSLIRRGSKPKVKKSAGRHQNNDDCVIS